jgi:hypothetical protein
MKTLTTSLVRPLRLATLTLLGMLVVSSAVEAQWNARRDGDRDRFGYYRRDGVPARSSLDYTVRRYHAYPHGSFTLSFGTGYAGRGYYYGPPDSSYYYQRPGVTYYRSWENVPRYYRGYSYAPRNGTAIAVQQALGRLGYYRGPVDGQIGPASRRAIMRFERQNGLPVTGVVTTRLLRSLAL